MMQRIQSIFNVLAGIVNFEADRLAQAHAIFCKVDRQFEDLDTPAYLRRRPRITSTHSAHRPL